MKWSDGSYNQLPETKVVLSSEQLAVNEKAQRAMAAVREIERAQLPPVPQEVATHGRCRGLPPEWFFAERGSGSVYARGRAVCAACPARKPCREWARAQPINKLTGLWGGESQRERRLLAEAASSERSGRSAAMSAR